ncbi:MAG: DUF58 domain-containing protein [Terriglobales bacterium]
MEVEQESHPARVAWRQSLGAGLLLGLALGCGWLSHWTPDLYPRLLLLGAGAVLALLGLGMMLALSDERGWTAAWQRRLDRHVTAAGLPFFAALVILTVAAITSGNNLLYLVASGLIAGLVVSGVAAAMNLSGMELRFRLPEEVFACRPAAVNFELVNTKSFWPAYALTVGASARPLRTGAMDAELSPIYFAYLPRKAAVSGTSELLFPRRGRYTSAAFVLETAFPFGLMRKRRRFESSRHDPGVMVFPAPEAGLDIPLARLREGSRLPLPRPGAGQELHRIRPHQAGDSARHVMWKASARAGALLVREDSEESALRVRLRLALDPGCEPEAVERALSRCAGWVEELARPHPEGEVWLEFVGENGEGLHLPLAPARRHRRRILEYLARLEDPRPRAAARPHAPGLHEIVVTGVRG